MCVRFFVLLLLVQIAWCRNVPRLEDLDEEDQQLFRAAYDSYDTPSYNQHEYEEDDLPIGKIDLVKDGLWAFKAKMTELKAFHKALAAQLLSTKLKLKELMLDKLIQKKKPHHEEKPYYPPSNYQAPQYAPPAQYAAPQYAAAQHYQAAQYAAHDPYYGH